METMLHRIFIAINLPGTIKNELMRWQEKWLQLPCRWANKENFHITLAFLGNVSDKELQGLKTKVGEIAKKHGPFQLNFTKIVYAPAEKNPKMIWAVGKESKELCMLQKDLANSLLRGSASNLDFTLHLTLGRLKEFEFRRIEPEERPEINEEINFEIPVNSIEIMESKLKRNRAEYAVIENYKLEIKNL